MPCGLSRNFASAFSQNRRPTDFGQVKIYDFMATNSASNTASATVGSKSLTANAATAQEQPVKTQRVLETRDQWVVIFNHTVSLVATLVEGKDLPTDPRKGFAFGAVKEQPHSRAYAQSLLAGFASKKAGKVFAQTEGLNDATKRHELAIAILLKTKLGGGDATKANSLLSKAEPKQAKAFAQAVLAALNPKGVAEPTTETPAPTEQPTEQPKPKRTSRKKAAK